MVINTGSGLKDIGAVMDATGGADSLAPLLDAVRRAVDDLHIPTAQA